MLNEARSNNLDVTVDQYPYIAGSTTLTVLLPPWALEGGIAKMLERLSDSTIRPKVRTDAENGLPGWEGYASKPKTVMVSFCRKTKQYEGKTLDEIAELNSKNPTEQLFDLLLENDGVASCILFQQSEANVKAIMRCGFTNFCTDGLTTGKPHPRLFGTFPRILGRYVRQEGVLTLEDAIRKMTSLPAQKLGLRGRGIIRERAYADIVIFDGGKVIDKATYEQPAQFPEGIEYVLVNGSIVVDQGIHTRATPGRVLRKRTSESC